jgi:class 3 adenylate cyclase
MPPKLNQRCVNSTLLTLCRSYNTVPDHAALHDLASAISERESVRMFVHDKDNGPELRALLVTDLERFTPTVQDLGDLQGRDFIRDHNSILRDCFAHHHGAEVAHTGDGFIASFSNASHALHCARAIQRALATFNAGRPNGPAMRVRVGIHSGRPLTDESRLVGTDVNTTVRVCAAAQACEVLVSEAVVRLLGGAWFTFLARGGVQLKGLAEPVALYEFDWRVGPAAATN